MDNRKTFDSLVAIMDRLRGEDGCPWDREQTYESLRAYLIEECYEVAEALDRGDAEGLQEELGDLLFQIVFLSRLAKEDGTFTVDDVVAGITDKMVRRHPHVFADGTAETSEEVLRKWEEIKRSEKAGQGAARPGRSILDGLPPALPALLKAQRLGAKAARVGFDWEHPTDVLLKIDEELVELRQAMAGNDRESSREEIGDLLFCVAMLARRMEIDPEAALEGTNRKFARRFAWIERELERRGIPLEEAGLERLEQLWQASKRSLDQTT